MKSLLRLLLVSLTSVVLCKTASAQLEGFYTEGIAGHTSFSLSTGGLRNNAFTNTAPNPLTTPVNSATVTSTETSSTAVGLIVGYQVAPMVAFEVSFVDAGSARARGTAVLNTPAASASTLIFSTRMHVYEWSGGVAGRYVFQNKLTFTGRIGLLASTAKWQTTAISSVIPPSSSAPSADKIFTDAVRKKERSTDLHFGLAASYKVRDHLDLGVAYDLYGGKQYAKIVSGSVRYSF